MYTIDLSYVEQGLHEELVAYIIAPYFTTDGQADLAVAATAISAIAAELGVPAPVPADEFYRTAITSHV